ncbi:MAG: amidohydrolase [Rhodospirillaceae bacterium]|nr:amidohydrolase [Rhodospirillaceae bacterium]
MRNASKHVAGLRKRIARQLLCAALAAWPSIAAADSMKEAVAEDVRGLMPLYRDLHASPELSMKEVKTAAKLAVEVRKFGFKVTEKVGVTGVVAVMENGPGPVLLIRADMDGLPVVEQTGLPYSSKVKGVSATGIETSVMHACGHDTHMTAWIATAKRLAAMKAQWSGTLVMILQPGEETSEGARAMLADGLFSRFPKPQYALAFHDSASLPAGMIGYTSGPAAATVDSVDLVVKGVGGHGAVPHATKDPIVVAARIVSTLQTLISRELDPQDAAVVTVGSFQAGAKHNVIPDEAKLLLTVRTYNDKARELMLGGIARIARGEAIAAGLPEDKMPVMTVERDLSTPAAINTPEFTAHMAQVFAKRFGQDRVTPVPPPMVGEDFGRYRETDPSIQSLLFWVGGVPKTKWDAAGGDTMKLPSLHSPFWAPEAETVIATATEAMITATLDILKK